MTTPQLGQSTFLLNCIWQSTICVGLGLVMSYLLRRRPARAHQILLLAMIAAVAVPVMSTVVRDFGWGLFVARPSGSAPLEDIARFDYEQQEEVAPVESAHIRLSPFEESAAPAIVSAPERLRIPWGVIFISGWMAAATILLTRLLVTFVLGVRLLGRAEPVNRTEIKQAVSLAKGKLRFNLPVRILCADRVCTVLIWCWTKRPILLVPRAIAQGGDKVDWVSVVCHELAHYKRRDHIWGLLAELAVCIFPWNVLVWLAKSRLVGLSEQACDDWVLASGGEADGYAESLLDLRPQKMMAFAPAVVGSRNGLAGRIRRILQERCPDPRTGVLWALAVTIITASLAVAGAFAQTRPPEHDDPKDSPPITEGAMRECIHERAPFEEVRRLITEDQLPVLYKMLEDETYAAYWHNVARVIGYVSDDPHSVSVLLRYFERGPSDKFSSIDSLSGKIWSLVFMGKIGGPLADSVLRKAVTEEGAARLARAWIDGELVADNSFWGSRNSVMVYIRSCAATGLVFSRKPENIDIVKRLYADYKTGKENNGLLEQHLAESLAINDFITDKSVEAYFSLETNDMLKALDPYIKKYNGRAGASRTGSERNEPGPRITFESEVHDFGQVASGSKNTCGFKFRNAGDAVLRIGEIKTSCGCTAASLEKLEYAPGESGTITVTYTASKRPTDIAKYVVVPTNDSSRPRVRLTIKASIVLWVNPEPGDLSLLLNAANAGCPNNITLTSIDGQPFAIKSISSPDNWFTADFDPNVQATKFVLKPEADVERLKGMQRGLIKIGVSHPKCDTVDIAYKLLPRFKISPASIVLRDVRSGVPVEKDLWVMNNYNEDFVIESVSFENDTGAKIDMRKSDKGCQLKLKITPPALAGRTFFRDALHIKIKDGEQLKVDVRGFYRMDGKNRPATRRRINRTKEDD